MNRLRMIHMAAALMCAAVVGASCTTGADVATGPAGAGGSLVVGAVYPLSGSQGQGGIDEYRGALMAADLVNQDGGVNGHTVRIRSIDVATADAAPGAVARLQAEGIDLVLGSYGSTISAPASEAAASRDMLFWETGAVGMLAPASDQGELTFRVPPTGEVLGASAIRFVHEQLAPDWDRRSGLGALRRVLRRRRLRPERRGRRHRLHANERLA